MNEDRATRYHRLKRQVSLTSLAWTVLLLAGLISTGWSVALRGVAESTAARLVPGAWLASATVVIYVFLLSLLSEIGAVPLGFYSGYVVERRYGLSNESFGAWAIDQATEQRFSEAFVAINANFQETFATLFGGGRAGLTLLDEGDPLESGIEIVAQPPGKRLQSVQLLSGGEKALTAIALMFGLFRYKPSPFCLLDEIDAPLDDANIGRFVDMLRLMQQQTQFILITHNRKTMEIADRLYGVTMEEPGVSKLISVQMN